jgi:hypothetical protein
LTRAASVSHGLGVVEPKPTTEAAPWTIDLATRQTMSHHSEQGSRREFASFDVQIKPGGGWRIP